MESEIYSEISGRVRGYVRVRVWMVDCFRFRFSLLWDYKSAFGDTVYFQLILVMYSIDVIEYLCLSMYRQSTRRQQGIQPEAKGYEGIFVHTLG